MFEQKRTITGETVQLEVEFWLIKSETHLAEGALAYWGPFATCLEATQKWRERFAADESIAVAEVPAP